MNDTEERMEEAEEGLREICILCGGFDPSNGEGTSPNEIVQYVKEQLQQLTDTNRHLEEKRDELNRELTEVKGLLEEQREFESIRNGDLVSERDLLRAQLAEVKEELESNKANSANAESVWMDRIELVRKQLEARDREIAALRQCVADTSALENKTLALDAVQREVAALRAALEMCVTFIQAFQDNKGQLQWGSEEPALGAARAELKRTK